VLTAFEIQVLNKGDWKIDSIFDDQELATFEANRVFGRGVYDTVRVVQEIYNEVTDTASARTIAELTRAVVGGPGKKIAETKKSARSAVPQMMKEAMAEPAANDGDQVPKPEGGGLWWLALVAKSVGISVGGLVLLFLLRLLYEFL